MSEMSAVLLSEYNDAIVLLQFDLLKSAFLDVYAFHAIQPLQDLITRKPSC